MLNPSFITGALDHAPVITATASIADRDEFGPLSGADGLFHAPLVPSALMVREDLGHALCAWLPSEDLL
ncbi:MAG TPA: hypothetical protein VNS09_18005 [Solirubrobacter sp.]|nr:hypothetical protein [Solirubrobacter sp.]